MDHVLENKFLGKEAMSKDALHEDEFEENKNGVEVSHKFSKEEVQFQIFESFVKEKHSLLAYVRALVIYSAEQRGLEPSQIASVYPDYMTASDSRVAKNEQDVTNFKNRIIIIVRNLVFNLCRWRSIKSNRES